MLSRNIVFPAAGEVALVEQQVRAPEGREVLCRARTSLVSIGTEMACLRGQYDPGTYWEEFISYPMSPGYSMVAEVVSTGPDATRWSPGDRVTSLAPHCEYHLVDEDQLFTVPDAIPDEDATWASLARTTQLGVRRAGLELGESVAVVGLGMLGQLVTQYLALSGARRVIAIDPAQSRVALAQKHGATHGLAVPVEEARAQIAELTDGQMLDAVFDITGHPAVLGPASLLLRKLGRLVLLGDSPTPSKQTLGPRIVGDSISVLGMHGFMYPATATVFNQWTAEAMTALFFDYLAAGRMDVGALVTHRFTPRDAETVYRDVAAKPEGALGILYDWGRSG